MSRLYLTYNEKRNCREYYSYEVFGSRPVYTTLTDQEISGLLQAILSNGIRRVKEINGSLIEIESHTGNIAIVDTLKVFSKKSDKHDGLISSLCVATKESIEKENIWEYKKNNPEKPAKVNRNRMSNKKLIASGLSLALGAVLVGSTILSEISKTRKMSNENDTPSVVAEIETPDFKDKLEEAISSAQDTLKEELSKIEIPEFDDSIRVSVGFDDVTDSGKLEQVIEDCSPYMEYWIDRYGLPANQSYAILSLESGVLECIEQKNGACGPTQLQLGAQHGEHYKLTVYKDGVPTGEYDEFWVADARKLDDPALQGKPLKIIQNLEDNFQIGCGYYQRCIDRYQNIFIATDAYNKGLYALTKTYEKCGDKIEKPLEYYKENFNDFSWTSIIPEHSKEVFGLDVYGDPEYIWDVLKHLDTDARGNAEIKYCCNGKVISVDITNANVYNNTSERGR